MRYISTNVHRMYFIVCFISIVAVSESIKGISLYTACCRWLYRHFDIVCVCSVKERLWVYNGCEQQPKDRPTTNVCTNLMLIQNDDNNLAINTCDIDDARNSRVCVNICRWIFRISNKKIIITLFTILVAL